MTSLKNLSLAHHAEPSDSSEAADLESQLIGLVISPDVSGREDGLHGSQFIECLDYSITSFDAERCSKQSPSKTIAEVNALMPSSTPSSPPSRRPSLRFVSLVRMLSLRNTSKRDISPNSVTTDLLELESESGHDNSTNSIKLGRRTSLKDRIMNRPLMIETANASSWSTGLRNKTFTPSFLLNSSSSPISLSSSTSGFSGESVVATNPRFKTYMLSGALLGTSRRNRSNSVTDIEHPLLPSSNSDSSNDFNPLESPTQSGFSRRRTSSQRKGKLDKMRIPSSSLIFSKLPQVKKKAIAKST